MHRNSIERKASLLLACLFAGCILGGCHNRIYSSPQPKIHFEQASTKSAKHVNLRHIMHDYTFRSKDMHHLVKLGFGFINNSDFSDDVTRTTPKASLLSGYQSIPNYEFDDNLVLVNGLPISDTEHPDSDHVLDYYINYTFPSPNELKLKESYSDGLTPDKATKGMFKRDNPSPTKQIIYKLHSISKSSTKPKHLKLIFYPTKDVLINNEVHDISKSQRKIFPLKLITHTKKHYKSYKKSEPDKHIHHLTRHDLSHPN